MVAIFNLSLYHILSWTFNIVTLCLKRLYFIPCQKMNGLILEKMLDGADFDFSLILQFAMIIRFAAFSSFMS